MMNEYKYYIACGCLTADINFKYTVNGIKECYGKLWNTAYLIDSSYKEGVYSDFVQNANYLRNKLLMINDGTSITYKLPFIFLFKGNKIIACAAQEIENGKLQPVTINWYIE